MKIFLGLILAAVAVSAGHADDMNMLNKPKTRIIYSSNPHECFAQNESGNCLQTCAEVCTDIYAPVYDKNGKRYPNQCTMFSAQCKAYHGIPEPTPRYPDWYLQMRRTII